jgi:hypothetical protein
MNFEWNASKYKVYSLLWDPSNDRSQVYIKWTWHEYDCETIQNMIVPWGTWVFPRGMDIAPEGSYSSP